MRMNDYLRLLNLLQQISVEAYESKDELRLKAANWMLNFIRNQAANRGFRYVWQKETGYIPEGQVN